MGVVARIAHGETEARGVFCKPRKGGRVLEACFGGRLAWGSDIDCTAAVMFAESGRGVDREYRVQSLAPRQLALEDSDLICT